MFWEEPSSTFKIVKFAHQQTLELLLSIFELLLSTSPQIFYYIWSYRTPIQAKYMALER